MSEVCEYWKITLSFNLILSITKGKHPDEPVKTQIGKLIVFLH